MGKESYELGLEGENTACGYLEQTGFKIVERNFRSYQGEIDIIAKDKNCLVFVEVKSYSFKSFSLPIYSVTKAKRSSIIYTARYYIHKNRLQNELCRFDVVAIYKKSTKETVVEHFKN